MDCLAKPGKWMDSGDPIILVDTPGLLDPTRPVVAIIKEIHDFLINIVGVNAFLLVFNGCSPRFANHVLSMRCPRS